MNLGEYFGWNGDYNGLGYVPHSVYVGAYLPKQTGGYSNAITDTLKECKRDKRYYIAKLLRRFYDLNKKAYVMHKAGELSKRSYEEFHRQCMWVLEDYERKFHETEESA